jgi:hypothetical protein
MRAAICILLTLGIAFPTSRQGLEFREGSSPQLAADTKGVVRMIFGRRDTIFFARSSDQGASFSEPAVVGIVPKMHLGNTRGPVIASSNRHSLVSAIDQAGNIHVFRLDHATARWTKLPRALNDTAGSAPEGLVGLGADAADGFYAAWLDVRIGRRNQLFFARLRPNASTWTANVLAYASPAGSICECCRPSVAVDKGNPVLMFRNSLDGSRDLYLTASTDGGITFTAPRKLGDGTWHLDACPMDGGALANDSSGTIGTVWRRENTVFYARPGEPEIQIGSGRSPMLSVAPSGQTHVVWQDGPAVKLKSVGETEAVTVGEGRLPQVLALRDGHVLIAWERQGNVYVRKI